MRREAVMDTNIKLLIRELHSWHASTAGTSEESGNVRKILYLSGTPGSGKTTCTEAVSRYLSIARIPEFLEDIPNWVLMTRNTDLEETRLSAQTSTILFFSSDILIGFISWQDDQYAQTYWFQETSL